MTHYEYEPNPKPDWKKLAIGLYNKKARGRRRALIAWYKEWSGRYRRLKI